MQYMREVIVMHCFRLSPWVRGLNAASHGRIIFGSRRECSNSLTALIRERRLFLSSEKKSGLAHLKENIGMPGLVKSAAGGGEGEVGGVVFL